MNIMFIMKNNFDKNYLEQRIFLILKKKSYGI